MNSSRALDNPFTEVASSIGRKVVHISMEDYTPRPLDLITDPWVTDNNARYVFTFTLIFDDPLLTMWRKIHIQTLVV